ncbi:Uncharacterised protein [Streptococcus pneumoniae]|nr:Uncharacterised protein [Streptococcus pneumoniae]
MVCFFSFNTLRKSLQTTSASPFKPRQRRLAVDMYLLRQFHLQPQKHYLQPQNGVLS